jgi:hypothetical protein
LPKEGKGGAEGPIRLVAFFVYFLAMDFSTKKQEGKQGN